MNTDYWTSSSALSRYAVVIISAEIAGILLCLLGGLLAVTFRRTLETRARHYFLAFFALMAVDLTVDVMTELVLRYSQMRAQLYLCHFLHMLLSPILAYVITLYLADLLDPQRARLRERAAVAGMLLVHIAMLFLMQTRRLFFTIGLKDGHNVFMTGPYYPLFAVWSVVPLLADMTILLRQGRRLTPRERLAFWIFCAIPALGAILTITIDTHILILAILVAALTMFIFILADQTERWQRQELAAAELRFSVMLSQIQPHFLYNALGAIYGICDKDPALAKEAINDFSDYLRANLSSLSRRTLVSFAEERRHIETYLKLEKLSMGEYLHYAFDCADDSFRLPALTVQPLVENAVKHGVSKCETGGTVTVSTRETPEAWLVIVRDDGAGFDPALSPRDDRRLHIGIENVRARLETLCGGTLTIDSAPGAGTTATVSIPKRAGGAASRRAFSPRRGLPAGRAGRERREKG